MNKIYSVAYSSEAKDDLMSIYSYIAFELKMSDTAEKQINRIREKIRALNLMPARYSPVKWEPWKSMGMHCMPVDNLIVYYLVDENNSMVTVVRIFYGGRNVENIIKNI